MRLINDYERDCDCNSTGFKLKHLERVGNERQKDFFILDSMRVRFQCVCVCAAACAGRSRGSPGSSSI